MKNIAWSIGSALWDVWQQQKEYNLKVKMIRPVGIEWSETYLLGLIGEIDEVLRALQWKRHRKYTNPVNKRDVGIELADVLKYLISLAQEQGFSPEDLLDLAYQKGQLLEKRFAQEWAPPAGRNVIVTDLDGTGADFQAGFGNWLAKNGYQERVWKSLNMDLDGQIPYQEYMRLKTQFESEGGYAELPAYPDWLQLIRDEQSRGTFVLVATARPAEQIHRVGLDTMDWLRNLKLEPDAILFGRDERILELIRMQQKNNKVLLLEDEPVLTIRAAVNGIPVMVRAQTYNEAVAQYGCVRRVKTYPDYADWDWVGDCRESEKDESKGRI